MNSPVLLWGKVFSFFPLTSYVSDISISTPLPRSISTAVSLHPFLPPKFLLLLCSFLSILSPFLDHVPGMTQYMSSSSCIGRAKLH